MTIMELTKAEKSGAMFRVIDATKIGYMSSPTILIEAGKDVVRNLYADRELVGFSASGKNKIDLYIK